MSFANQRSILINDRDGNLYNFRWDQDKITLIFFDGKQQKYETCTLVEESSMEFDAILDEEDHIYFVCQKKDNTILLMSLENGSWVTNNLGGGSGFNIYNLNTFSYHNAIHIIYCVPSKDDNVLYRIVHHFYDQQKWHTLEVSDITRKNLLNPFQIVNRHDQLILGYYDVVDGQEQIFIKEFDREKNLWKPGIQLTSNYFDKLYMDILMMKDSIVHLTYATYQDGNLSVIYEKHKIGQNKTLKILDHTLSNPGNCTHPTFVMSQDKLWDIWTEYDQVVSCFTTDGGLTWSFPYQWRESKDNVFFRYKFYTNGENIKDDYQLNYTFGKDYPEFSFVGFGSLEKATEMALKVKKNEKREDGFTMELKEVDGNENMPNSRGGNQEALEGEITWEEVEKMQQDMKKLQERIEAIEEFLNRRKRGILFNTRK